MAQAGAENLRTRHGRVGRRIPEAPSRTTATQGSKSGHPGAARVRFSPLRGQTSRPAKPTRGFPDWTDLRSIRFHCRRHSTATLLLERGVGLIVIKELLGHAHIGVTATVYAHVRLRLQRDAIDLLGRTLRNPGDGDEPPLCAAPVR
ncbi:tyrosine-type recombinase/integrase [Streptomyces noursei]